MSGVCPTCGRPLSDVDHHIRFGKPEPVLDIPDDELATRAWISDTMMAVAGVGNFIRSLLPVHLDDDSSVTFGVWFSVRFEDLERASSVWEEPEYGDLRLEGHLANSIPPWDAEVLSARAVAEVRNLDHLPYITATEHPLLHEVMTRRWPAADVRPALGLS